MRDEERDKEKSFWFGLFVRLWFIIIFHGFKNWTGPAGSTGDWCLIRSGSLKKPQKWKNRPKTGNRRFDRQNREPKRLNRFWLGSPKSKTTPFCKIFFPLPCPNWSSFSFFSLTPLPHKPSLPHAAACPFCLTPPLPPSDRSLSLSVTPSLSRSLRLCLGHSVSVSVSPSLSRSRSLQICPSLSRSLCLSLNHSVSISVSPNLSRSLTVSPHTGVFHSHFHGISLFFKHLQTFSMKIWFPCVEMFDLGEHCVVLKCLIRLS